MFRKRKKAQKPVLPAPEAIYFIIGRAVAVGVIIIYIYIYLYTR